MRAVIIQPKPFRAAFDAAAKASPRSTPKEILKSVLVEVVAGDVRFTGADLEVSVLRSLGAAGVGHHEPGRAVVPAERFGRALASLPDGEIVLEASGGLVSLCSGRARVELAAGNPDEFPAPGATWGPPRAFDAPAMARAARRTVFATDEAGSGKYALGGCLIEDGDGLIRVVASDGRRLSVAEVGAGAGAVRGPGRAPVVPARTMRLLADACKDQPDGAEGTACLSDDGGRVRFEVGATVIVSALIAGRFPRWESILPTSGPRAGMEADALKRAVAVAQIATNAETRGVDLAFDPAGTLTLSGVAADVGRAVAELPIDYAGPEATFRVSVDYLAQYLASGLDAEHVRVLVNGKKDPLLFEVAGYSHVIMPMSREK